VEESLEEPREILETDGQEEKPITFLYFYNEDGDLDGEVYPLHLFEKVEEAIYGKTVIGNTDVEEYNKMGFLTYNYSFSHIEDPFTGDYYVDCNENSIDDDLIFVSNLEPIKGKLVMLEFWDSSSNLKLYGVFKI